MNQSGTSDTLLGSEEGALSEDRLPDSDRGGAAPRQRVVEGSRRGPAAEEITEAPSSSPESSEEEDRVPDPEEEQEKFGCAEQLMELDDRPAKVRARLRKQWQKQRTASILSVLTMDCLRTAKDPMDSNNQEELEPDSPHCRFNLEAFKPQNQMYSFIGYD